MLPHGIAYRPGCGPVGAAVPGSLDGAARVGAGLGECDTELLVRMYDLASHAAGDAESLVVTDIKRRLRTDAAAFSFMAEATEVCGKYGEFSPGALFRIKKVMDGAQKDDRYNDTILVYGPVDLTNAPLEGARERVLGFSSFIEHLPEPDIPDDQILPSPP